MRHVWALVVGALAPSLATTTLHNLKSSILSALGSHHRVPPPAAACPYWCFDLPRSQVCKSEPNERTRAAIKYENCGVAEKYGGDVGAKLTTIAGNSFSFFRGTKHLYDANVACSEDKIVGLGVEGQPVVTLMGDSHPENFGIMAGPAGGDQRLQWVSF